MLFAASACFQFVPSSCRCALVCVPWCLGRLSLFSTCCCFRKGLKTTSPQAKHSETDPRHAISMTAHLPPPESCGLWRAATSAVASYGDRILCHYAFQDHDFGDCSPEGIHINLITRNTLFLGLQPHELTIVSFDVFSLHGGPCVWPTTDVPCARFSGGTACLTLLV